VSHTYFEPSKIMVAYMGVGDGGPRGALAPSLEIISGKFEII